jgi:hypothetical protein
MESVWEYVDPEEDEIDWDDEGSEFDSDEEDWEEE